MMDNTSQKPDMVIQSRQDTRSRVVIGGQWAELLASLGPRLLLVADARLDPWIEVVGPAIGAQSVLRLPISEAQKTLATVQQVYAWLGGVGATRDTVVVAMGGGVLTDLVGYAAATYLRGITWAALPTSLLAQVDAAIGGKVGVNTDWGKNLVGAFHLPAVVAVDSQFLTTLPRREWRTGLGEVMKSALIHGGWLYERLGHLELPPPGEVGEWEPVVAETASIKVEVVNRDLYEDGPRMFLNFGHTVGHALENLLGYGVLTHGEAVGLGSLVALRLSEEYLHLSPQVRETVRRWMASWGLPLTLRRVDFEELWERLTRDKKARVRGLTWVLLHEVGAPRLVQDVRPESVQRALAELS